MSKPPKRLDGLINFTHTAMKFFGIIKGIVSILALFILAVLSVGFFSLKIEGILGLIADYEFIHAIYFSFVTSITATLLSFLLGMPSGFFLARSKSKFSKLIDTLFDIPLVLPPLIVGVLLLMAFNLPVVKEVYAFIFSISGAIIAQFFIALPYTIKSSKSSFEMVPQEYEQIAMTLGAKPFRAFYDTTFKIAFPGVISGLILTWLRCIGEFGATLLVGGGIPSKTTNIPINIYLNMTSGDFEKGIALSMLTILIFFCCIFFIKLILNRKSVRL